MKKKIETSKIIIAASFIVATIITIDAMILMHITQDTSALSYIIPSVYTVLTAATGFYYWKAKSENKIKLRNQAIKDILELKKTYGSDEVDMAESDIDKIDNIINDDSSFSA